MSSCRDCSAPITWEKIGGRNVPLDPSTREDHRDSCASAPSRPCKICGSETLYRKGVKVDAGTEKKHECVGVVPAGISYSPRRHATMSEVTTYEECALQGFYRFVLGLPERTDRTDAEAGILGHESIAHTAVVRHKAGELAKPVTGGELSDALDVVVARNKRVSSLEAVAKAREQLLVAAPQVDLSFALADEHGVYAERGYEVPVGNGVLAGSTADLVERVGNVILVTDWKFSNAYDAPKRKPRDMFQVALGLAWAHMNWPGLEVRFVLRYVVLGEVVEVAWDEDLDASARARARAYVERRRAQRENESAWAPTFGAHCSYCSFTARCPAFKEQMSKQVPEREPVTLPEIAEEIHRWAPIATVADKYVERLRRAGKSIAATELGGGRGELLAGRFPVRLKTIARKGYTVEPSSYQVLEVGDPIDAAATINSTSEPATAVTGTGSVVSSGVFPELPPPAAPAAEPERESATRAASGEVPAAGEASTVSSPSAQHASGASETAGAEISSSIPNPTPNPLESSAPATNETPTGDVSAVAAPLGSAPGIATGDVGRGASGLAFSPPGGSAGLTDEIEFATAPIPEPFRFDPRREEAFSNGADEARPARGPIHVPAPPRAPESTPASAPPVVLTLEDGLSRIGRYQVTHVEKLIAIPDDDSVGELGSEILRLAEIANGGGAIGKSIVDDARTLVGGEWTKGSPPRRKPLRARQLRELLLLLPVKFPPETEKAAEPLDAGTSVVTEALGQNGGAPW